VGEGIDEDVEGDMRDMEMRTNDVFSNSFCGQGSVGELNDREE
jgi:hypothetical protein